MGWRSFDDCCGDEQDIADLIGWGMENYGGVLCGLSIRKRFDGGMIAASFIVWGGGGVKRLMGFSGL